MALLTAISASFTAQGRYSLIAGRHKQNHADGLKDYKPHLPVSATDALLCREKEKLWKEVRASDS